MRTTQLTFVLLLIFLLSACATGPVFPPNTRFIAQLTEQQDGGTACQDVRPHISITAGNTETMSVMFGDSLKSIQIKPEGDIKSDAPVVWSAMSASRATRYVQLSTPARLGIGKIKKYVKENVCVKFMEAFFVEKTGYSDFRALSGEDCCGILVAEKM